MKNSFERTCYTSIKLYLKYSLYFRYKQLKFYNNKICIEKAKLYLDNRDLCLKERHDSTWDWSFLNSRVMTRHIAQGSSGHDLFGSQTSRETSMYTMYTENK